MKHLVATIFFLAYIVSLSAHATTVLYKDFENLVDESDHVVGGKVSKMKQRKHRDGEIYTTIILRKSFTVTESGRVDSENPIKIRYKGGEVAVYGADGEKTGVEGVRANGTPEIRTGDQVILFVSNNGIADMPIYGWQQGLFVIDENEGVNDAKGTPIVGLSGSHFIRNTANGLKSNGKQMEARRSEAGATPVLISSDGGGDTLVTEAALNGETRAEKATFAPMHVTNFVSMIQERKAANNSRAAARKIDTKDLFTLPHVGRARAKPSASGVDSTNERAGPSVDSGQVAQPSAGDAFVPLLKPRTADVGE